MSRSPTGTHGKSERRRTNALAEVVVGIAQLLRDNDATDSAYPHVRDRLFKGRYDGVGAHLELVEVLVFPSEGAALGLLPASSACQRSRFFPPFLSVHTLHPTPPNLQCTLRWHRE